MSKNISHKVRHERNTKLAEGFRKHLAADGDGLIIHRKKRANREIDADLQRRIDAQDKVTAVRAMLQGAIMERERVEAETEAVYAAVRQTAFIMYGDAPAILSDFGLAPARARRALTVGEKADAAAKALRTRAARHTMGRRQRLRIRADTDPGATPTPSPLPRGPRIATPPSG
jgi:hypothetical protein